MNSIINYAVKYPENKSTSSQIRMENFSGNCVQTLAAGGPVALAATTFYPFKSRKIRNILGIGAINRCYVRSG